MIVWCLGSQVSLTVKICALSSHLLKHGSGPGPEVIYNLL